MLSKRAQLAKQWVEVAGQVAEWADYLQQTTGTPDVRGAEQIVDAHRVILALTEHARALCASRV